MVLGFANNPWRLEIKLRQVKSVENYDSVPFQG